MPTYCPQCRTIRRPDGVFCHMCGYNYLAPGTSASSSVGPAPGDHEARVSVGSGFRFGIGFMTAAVVFWLLFALFSSALFAGLIGGLLQAIPH